MRIEYDNQDDILHIEFSKEPIVKDVSHGWNVNVGYGAKGIAEITILDAKADGYWPLENINELLPLAAQILVNTKASRSSAAGAFSRPLSLDSMCVSRWRPCVTGFSRQAVHQNSQVCPPALGITLRKLTTAHFSSRILRSRTISRYCFSINGAGRVSEFFHREIAPALAPMKFDI